jgi:hypothetical protein
MMLRHSNAKNLAEASREDTFGPKGFQKLVPQGG